MKNLTAQDLLDAIPDAAAVVDDRGVIVAVNRSWRGFALDNDGDESTEPGANYLDICLRAASESPEALAAAEDLKAVISGGSRERDLDYACETPDTVHWFTTRVTAVPNSDGWALITHVNVTRHKRAVELLEDRARRDSLTGLLHRAAIVDHLDQCLATAVPVGVAFVDLNRFKPINDVYGHAAGDEVLQRVAGRLRNLQDSLTEVGRYGGDEFVLVREHTDGAALASLIFNTETALAEPMIVRGSSLHVTASVGGCVALSREPAEYLLHRADQAMYDKKRRLASHL